MFSKVCTPAQVYLVMTLLSTIYYVVMMVEADNKQDAEGKRLDVHMYTFVGLFFKLLFAVLWFVFLNYLCKNGHTRMAWFFLLLPVVLMIFLLILGSFFLAYMLHSRPDLKKMKHSKKRMEGMKNGYGLSGAFDEAEKAAAAAAEKAAKKKCEQDPQACSSPEGMKNMMGTSLSGDCHSSCTFGLGGRSCHCSPYS